MKRACYSIPAIATFTFLLVCGCSQAPVARPAVNKTPTVSSLTPDQIQSEIQAIQNDSRMPDAMKQREIAVLQGQKVSGQHDASLKPPTKP